MTNSKHLSRRHFSALLAAAPALLHGKQTSSQSAHIKIDTDRKIGAIDPKLYGNFIEHLGRCITGGIFDEGNRSLQPRRLPYGCPQSGQAISTSPSCAGPAATSRRTTTGATASAPATNARAASKWPGAPSKTTASARTNFSTMWQKPGSEPYICTNLGTGTWDEAQQWVEYVCSDQDTAITRLRKKNGREKPWKVNYWGLGNEMDGPWQMGHRSADDYGKFALEAAKLMHWTDPSIKLIAAGSSLFAGRLDRLEPHRPQLSQAARRLSLAPHVRRQSRQRLLRLPSLHSRISRPHQDHRRHHPRSHKLRPHAASPSTSPGTNGTSGIAPAATKSAAAASSKSTTIWKTLSSSPVSSTPSSITPTSSKSPTWRS